MKKNAITIVRNKVNGLNINKHHCQPVEALAIGQTPIRNVLDIDLVLSGYEKENADSAGYC